MAAPGKDFVLDRNGFRFVSPRHQGRRFLRRRRNQARLLPGDGSADQSRERRQARRRIRSYAAHRRRRICARRSKSARSCAACTTTTPNGRRPQRVRDILPDEAEELLKRPLRHHPGVAADPASGRNLSAGHGGRADAVAGRHDRLGAARSRPHRPDLRDQVQSGAQMVSGSRACGARRRYVFKVFDSGKDGRARWTAHTAFDDPTTPPHARPRESIEIRTLAFF